jgi:hypothetical protein
MRRQMEQEAVLAAQQIVAEAETGIQEEIQAPVDLVAPIMEAPEVEPVAQTPVAPPVEIPVVVAPVPAPVVEPAPEPEPEPEEELTFAEALKQFEQRQAEEDNEDRPEDDERTRKLKEDRRKRQTLVFDPKAGKVVAQKKHKGGRQDWLDALSEDEEDLTEDVVEEEVVETEEE